MRGCHWRYAGLGKAVALGIAEAGADVVAASRRPEEAEKVAREIEALGRRTLRATVDIRSRPSIEALQQKVLETFRKVEHLENAAGITLKTPTLECTEEGLNSVIDINLNGTWRCCQIFGKTMVSQGFGKILKTQLAGRRGWRRKCWLDPIHGIPPRSIVSFPLVRLRQASPLPKPHR